MGALREMLMAAKDDSYDYLINKKYLENAYLTGIVNQICNLD